MCNR
ncbi:hypothetical protein D039_3262A, partial [Vibrio parahaemolyticus EKP-028]